MLTTGTHPAFAFKDPALIRSRYLTALRYVTLPHYFLLMRGSWERTASAYPPVGDEIRTTDDLAHETSEAGAIP